MPRVVPKQPPAPAPRFLESAFPFLAGLFLFLTIIKLGDPVILDSATQPPANLSEVYYLSWPAKWGIWMAFPLAIAGLLAVAWNRVKFKWFLALPALWLAWQFIASGPSVSAQLTNQTLAHFTVCVTLFYLGCFAMAKTTVSWPIFAGISLALCWTIHSGVEQHFGGLEATRRMFSDPKNPLTLSPEALKNPDFIKRLASDRIYATFVYANAFAGALVLTLPMALAFLWQLTPKVRFPMRLTMLALFGGIGLACLYWSGSKAGWLVALTLGLLALGHSAVPAKWKRALICGLLVLGVAAFAVKYAAFFKKERNSVGARFGYWRAAMIVIRNHPLVGTGPGTFQIPYRQLQRPSDEPTRLCHNDYLEQASDSGIPGFVIYSGMILVLLYKLYRYSSSKETGNWVVFCVWLGAFGLCLHSIVEFHLYIPALAWTEFFLMGWLAGRMN